ncbi:MAG: NAD-dependent epimerase/dehydratase family protein, partial [Spirochaetaceae bacterium]
MKALVTGAAGFIGFHLAKRLAERGAAVVGIDNLNDYYDVGLKHGRLAELGVKAGNAASAEPVRSARYDNLSFRQLDVSDAPALRKLFEVERFDVVVHLAAQAGVRYSID